MDNGDWIGWRLAIGVVLFTVAVLIALVKAMGRKSDGQGD